VVELNRTVSLFDWFNESQSNPFRDPLISHNECLFHGYEIDTILPWNIPYHLFFPLWFGEKNRIFIMEWRRFRCDDTTINIFDHFPFWFSPATNRKRRGVWENESDEIAAWKISLNALTWMIIFGSKSNLLFLPPSCFYKIVYRSHFETVGKQFYPYSDHSHHLAHVI